MKTISDNSHTENVTTPRPLREGLGGGSARWFAAFFLLFSGVGMAVAGFIVEPTGSISESVLMFTAQCFICAGSFVGIDVLLNEKMKSLFRKIKKSNS